MGCRSILQTTGGQQRIGNTCSGNQKHKAERTELAKAEPFHQNHRQQHQPRHAETQRNDVERRQCGLEPETGQDERTGPHENPGQPQARPRMVSEVELVGVVSVIAVMVTRCRIREERRLLHP